MPGSQRNTDAGVRGDLMAETFVRHPDRIEDPGYEVRDLVEGFDRGLHDGEFVATEPCDEIVWPGASAQAHRHGFQQFIADQVAERIVDALEFVDVDVEHRQLFAVRDATELALQLFVEQCPVRQIGQRIVMRQMRDALLGAPALGDILQRRYPSAMRQRTVHHLDRASARCVHDRLKYLSLRQSAEELGAIFIHVTSERTDFLPMIEEFMHGATWLHHRSGYTEHLDVTLVGDHQPPR